jgi:polyisoprenoid-binding protein YceI
MTTTTANPTTSIVPGIWTIDPSHSEVSFSVRHLMVSKVRGSFTRFTGTITTGQEASASSVEATIDMNSVDTRDERRDTHVRSADFFDVERYPEATFRSTAVRANGNDYIVEGNLTLHGVTRPVTLSLEHNGVGPDAWGGTRAGFSATAEINRRDFGVDINLPLEGGGVVVGDKVTLYLEVEATLQAAA